MDELNKYEEISPQNRECLNCYGPLTEKYAATSYEVHICPICGIEYSWVEGEGWFAEFLAIIDELLELLERRASHE